MPERGRGHQLAVAASSVNSLCRRRRQRGSPQQSGGGQGNATNHQCPLHGCKSLSHTHHVLMAARQNAYALFESPRRINYHFILLSFFNSRLLSDSLPSPQNVRSCRRKIISIVVCERWSTEMSKSIVKGFGIGFFSCIGIDIGKTISQVLVLVLLKASPSIGHKPLIKPCRDT